MQCIDDVCLEVGHWILAIAGVIALGGAALITLHHAVLRFAAVLQGLAAALVNFMWALVFLIAASVVGFLLYCAITGTWFHVSVY